MTAIPRVTHAVSEGASNLELDFPDPPRSLRIVVAHLARRPHQHLFCEVSRNAAGSGEGADAEALGVKGRFLLAARRV
jgi:hypothetical protein